MKSVRRPIPPPDPEELRKSTRKVAIAIFINPLKPCDNIWDALPEFIQKCCSELEFWEGVAEHRVKFRPVLCDMMSFGICTCNNRPDCKEHHPRNVLVNWRYKVRRWCVIVFFFSFFCFVFCL